MRGSGRGGREGYLLVEALVGLVVAGLALAALVSVLAVDTAWSEEQAEDRAAEAILDAAEDAILAAGYPGGEVGVTARSGFSASGGSSAGGPYRLEVRGQHRCTGVPRTDANPYPVSVADPCPGERASVLWEIRLTHPAPGSGTGRAVRERRVRVLDHAFQEPHAP